VGTAHPAGQPRTPPGNVADLQGASKMEHLPHTRFSNLQMASLTAMMQVGYQPAVSSWATYGSVRGV
jgi:hypothetical protein